MINDYNENMSKLLENRLLILQLLHFECTLLEYLPKMLLGEGIDIGHGGELSIVRLQELFRSYYLIMNKLCYGEICLFFVCFSELILFIFCALIHSTRVNLHKSDHPIASTDTNQCGDNVVAAV